MLTFRIGEISGMTGKAVTTIRRAEKDGRIPMARRDSLGHRYWVEDDLPAIHAVLGVPRQMTFRDLMEVTDRLWAIEDRILEAILKALKRSRSIRTAE